MKIIQTFSHLNENDNFFYISMKWH